MDTETETKYLSYNVEKKFNQEKMGQYIIFEEHYVKVRYIVEVEGKEYALLLSADDKEDDELVLMRLTKDGEDYLFESIDDEDEFNTVAEYVESMDEEE